MTVNPHQSTSTPTVTITLSSASGPALFLTGPIDNLGGTVSITNSYGSIGQTNAISARRSTCPAPMAPSPSTIRTKATSWVPIRSRPGTRT